MNDYVFRGKEVQSGRWVYGFLYMCRAKAYILLGSEGGKPICIEVDPDTVSMYTGQRDMNGHAIYGGDYLEAEYEAGAKCLTTVEWVDHGWCIVEDGKGVDPLDRFARQYNRVVGNKWDNPCMMEEQA